MIRYRGPAFRLAPIGAAPDDPVQSPVGRFHHSGQAAIYCSLTEDGAAVAIKRYLDETAAARQLWVLDVDAARVLDMRGRPALSIVWQDIHATGAPAPTWAFSDRARAAGAQAMLYSSRARPDLDHLVLFDEFARILRPVGPPRPFPA